MKKIKFIQFNSSQEFEAWQDINDTVEITQINPIVLSQSINGLNFSHERKNETIFPVYGIMVFYIEYNFKGK